MRLEGKTAVITGAASGIGAATAECLATAGARVVIADIDTERGGAKAKALAEAGGDAVFERLDVADDASIAAFAGRYGAGAGIDIVVNGAGWGKIEPFVQNDPAYIRRVVEINFFGPVKLTQALLPGMVERGSGRLVFISSDAGRVGSLGETVYAGAKGGVIGFTKSLAREMARHNITANCVCPGPTETPLLAAVPEKHRDAFRKAIPMRRFADPSEIADAVLFFASERARYVTGQILSVSGGLTMVG